MNIRPLSVRTLRRPLHVLSLLAVLGLVTTLTAPAAEAATKHWVGHSYSLANRWHIKGFGCVRVLVSGRIAVQHWSTPRDPTLGGGSNYDSFGPKIKRPEESMIITPGRCGPAHPYSHYPRATKVKITQMYYGYPECSPHWSFSAGAPFSFSVGIAPSCSSAKRITRTTHDGKGHFFDQKNSGIAGIFNHTAGSTGGYPTLCARVATAITVYHRTSVGRQSDHKLLSLGRTCA